MNAPDRLLGLLCQPAQNSGNNSNSNVSPASVGNSDSPSHYLSVFFGLRTSLTY